RLTRQPKGSQPGWPRLHKPRVEARRGRQSSVGSWHGSVPDGRVYWRAMDEIEPLRRQCFLGARFLWRELREIYGHVSVRLPDGKGFLLMMARVPEPPVHPDDIM